MPSIQIHQVSLSLRFLEDCFTREVVRLTSCKDFPEDICTLAKVYLKSVAAIRVHENHAQSIYKTLESTYSSKVF